MKKLVFFCGIAALFSACANNAEVKGTSATTTDSSKTETSSMPADLPYTAAYSAKWSNEVSDADLKTVLQSYKDWETGDMNALAGVMGDSVEIDMSNGNHYKKSNADLMKMWTTSRDSLSSVQIKMDTWNKMYATDKNEGYVVTWYDETDTYKNGKVDSASYHDINQIKNGKIVWYAQYKRPKKKM